MFDDTAALFHENVIVAYQDFINARTSPVTGRSQDLRLALAVAAALYHFREHLPNHLRRSRGTLEKKCADYGLLGDVVNASKHGELTQGAPRVRRATDIEETVVVTEYRDDQGTYRDAEKIISVTLTDRSVRELGDVINNVLNFWLTELYAMKILPKSKTFVLPTKAKPVSREQSVSPNLEMIQGVRFKQRWQLMRYDYETSSTKPIDLTGTTIEFQIYKPAELDLVLTHKETGKSLTRKVLLNRDELEAFEKLNSGEEKQEYLANLDQSREALKELAEEAKRFERSLRGSA
jgi:hypothetical protein